MAANYWGSSQSYVMPRNWSCPILLPLGSLSLSLSLSRSLFLSFLSSAFRWLTPVSRAPPCHHPRSKRWLLEKDKASEWQKDDRIPRDGKPGLTEEEIRILRIHFSQCKSFPMPPTPRTLLRPLPDHEIPALCYLDII
eukprot:TRINITY_DN2911_c0_g1_i1.p1 TRINITY_DN2911_c0_g1~~TRINITY_DN2911_c0_g1_i1.p1  ORF type:complete len:138 (+),score=6.53 TRINITY_DN2911_c0_g1_i1:377-790(+)